MKIEIPRDEISVEKYTKFTTHIECSLDVPGLDFSNPGTKEHTGTKEQVQEQVCFLPPYVLGFHCVQ